MGAAEHVRALVQPIIDQEGAELYDLEHESGILRISVDREGGIDVDTIGELARLISDALDISDPIPEQHYLLEVTSPGIERKLRTPEHFRRQTGNTVNLKVRTPIEGSRRVQGTLQDVDDIEVVVVLDDSSRTEPVRIPYDDIETARSVFNWAETTGDTRTKKKRAASVDITDGATSAQSPSAQSHSDSPSASKTEKAAAR